MLTFLILYLDYKGGKFLDELLSASEEELCSSHLFSKTKIQSSVMAALEPVSLSLCMKQVSKKECVRRQLRLAIVVPITNTLP